MWYPRIPAGMITIIGAKGGSCKGLTSRQHGRHCHDWRTMAGQHRTG